MRLCNIVFVYLYVCSYMCVYISARGENVFDKNVCSDHETVPIDEINIEATIKGRISDRRRATDGGLETCLLTIAVARQSLTRKFTCHTNVGLPLALKF